MKSFSPRVPGVRALLLCLAACAGLAAVPGAASAASCTPALTDSQGFLWDLQNDGDMSDGTNDAFDGYGFLSLTVAATNNDYPAAAAGSCTTEEDGREIVYPTVSLAGLDVARKVYVPTTGAFARWTDIISNPTAAPILIDHLDFTGDLGSDSSTRIRATSSGDLVLAPPDAWVVSDESLAGNTPSDPAVGHIFDGSLTKADAADAFSGPTDADGNSGATYNAVTVPAGGTVVYMHAAIQRSNSLTDLTIADTTRLSRGPAELYAGLSDAERGALQNFPADGDGDADGIANRADNCPDAANADQLNTDGDAQGDACDADDDNDGYSDDVESALGTDQKKADSDADGVADKSDACPTRAGSAANQGCVGEDTPPTVAFTAPAANASIKAVGTTLTANATDDKGIKEVRFIDDAKVVCTDTAAPYTCAYQPTGDDVGKNTLAAVAVDTANQTAVDLRVAQLGRFAPGKLSASVSPSSDRSAPFSFTTKGKLALPAGVTKAQGCSDGIVSVQTKAGTKTISTRRVTIKKDCTYSSTVSFADRKRFTTSGVLKSTARFGGNDVLSRSAAASKTVKTK